MTSSQLTSPLIDKLVPALPLKAAPATPRASLTASSLRQVALVVAGVAFLALLAQLRLQIGPVPVTGQTLGVLLLGAAYGVRLGTLATGAYLLLGAAGLPIFTGGQAGLAYALGPTGGYLLGFVVAAALLGYLAERGWDRTLGSAALAMLVASCVIYACGLAWLHVVLGGAWLRTLQVGLFPFLLGDLLKLLVAAVSLPAAWRFVGRR
ncbi:MAG: biotin transporter BioY [Trueperaceae bacterium]|nr:biotin transporter BioY [Trueperaceae bacterium]MCO5174965.1 biotin transporter BioY [Trueperaceae bacterium]MCW5819486.1 biotin transporter BioY [Trueperaceae bacterium]